LNDKIIVMLATEGTYPFHQGGVSTWCDILVQKLKSVDYVLYSVLMNPFVTQKFHLPNQDALIKMPLWGTEEPAEHLNTPFSHIYKMKKNTSEADIARDFIPQFRELITEIIADTKEPRKLAHILLQLHQYFQQYEYKVTFKSEQTWNTYKELVLKASSQKNNRLGQPDIFGLNQSLGWVYRFLNIVNTPLPEAHVTHSSAAAFCGIPCVLSKLANNTPYLLTEHGVYLREQYLALSGNQYSSFLSTFLIRFVQSITTMNYAFADQVSPVCSYNARWETRFGVPRSKIDVIYNGVDRNIFVEASGKPQMVPTVVMVARIDPIKDILTFIRAAALVRDQLPEAKFIVYGSVSVPAYYEECLTMKDELQLDQLIFAGHTSNMAAAYQSGDITVLSSISEAFPYSVVEAMMTGKPVIATDVGGVHEALGDTGILVQPRDPRAMADSMLKLLRNRELRDELGREARQRALNYFTMDRVLELHLKSYIKLVVGAEEQLPETQVQTRTDDVKQQQLVQQKLYMERAYTLVSYGYDQKAIDLFKKALWIQPDSRLAPLIIVELAQVFNRLGDHDRAFHELDKYEAYMALIGDGNGRTA
jgi:glycosyltransferase involved in cell wall biosynthesis